MIGDTFPSSPVLTKGGRSVQWKSKILLLTGRWGLRYFSVCGSLLVLSLDGWSPGFPLILFSGCALVFPCCSFGSLGVP